MSTSSDNMQPEGSGVDAQPHVDALLLAAAHFERLAAADALAGEVSHEIAHTLSFLRVLVEEGTETACFSSEDATIARREFERLSRLMRHLRRLTLSSPAPSAVPLREVVLRAVATVAGASASVQVSPSISIPADVALMAEPSLVYILIRDLLDDVVRGANQSGAVEICVTLPNGQPTGNLEVWGPSTQSPPRVESNSDPFDPWNAGHDERATLGLAVAYRIARVFGWKLEPVSDERREGMRLIIPAAAFHSESR